MDRQHKFSDVPIRVRSWIVIIAIVVIAVLHPLLMKLFVCSLTFIAAHEFLSIHLLMFGKQKNIILIVLCILEFIFLSFFSTPFYFFLFACFYTCIILIFSLFLQQKINDIFFVSKIAFGIFLCVYSIGILYFIYLFSDNTFQISYLGIRLLWFLLLLTEFNDVFQYLVGKTFGKHIITPKISPNKTVEGFLGGILLTTLLANFLGYILFSVSHVVLFSLLGVLIAILGFLGDLFMSYIKRRVNVKDTSNLIPGHGGLLDRMDSLLFVVPFFYFLCFYK